MRIYKIWNLFSYNYDENLEFWIVTGIELFKKITSNCLKFLLGLAQEKAIFLYAMERQNTLLLAMAHLAWSRQ